MPRKISVRFIIILVILLALFLPPFVKYQELRWRYRSFEFKIKALREEIKRLEAEKVRLQTDITYVERKAREKIGVAKKGEIILKGTPTKK